MELRNLSQWSEAHVWCCPEQHGTITAVFKNQIDWIPLSLGSVRPTQGRTLAVAQASARPTASALCDAGLHASSSSSVNTAELWGRSRMLAHCEVISHLLLDR